MRLMKAIAFLALAAVLILPAVSGTWVTGNFDKEGRAPAWGVYASQMGTFSSSDDGQDAVVTTEQGKLTYLNGETGEVYWNYDYGKHMRFKSEISADGQFILACSYDDILFFSTSSNTPIWTKPIVEIIEWNFFISITDDGSLSLVVYNDRGFLYSDSGQLVEEYDFGEFDYARAQISGNGLNIVGTNGNNVISGITIINYYNTNSTTPIWSVELNGTGVECETSRSGDIVFIAQRGMGKFTPGDPWGISHALPSGAIVGTSDYFGGATLFSDDGTLLWTIEMEGIESFDMDRDGNWFCFSGQNGKCVLMDRTSIRSNIQKPDGWWVEYVGVSSEGTWSYAYKETLYAHDKSGVKVLERVIRAHTYSRCIIFTGVSDDGSLIYVNPGGVLLAFKTGHYPKFNVLFESEIFTDEPFDVQIINNSPGVNGTKVELFFENSNDPASITDPDENLTLTFTEDGTHVCTIVLQTEDGNSAMTEVNFNVEDRPEKETGYEFLMLSISSILILILVFTLVRRGKMRKR